MPPRFPRYRGPSGYKGVQDKTLFSAVEAINKKFEKEHSDGVLTTLENSIFSQPLVYVPSGIISVDCCVCYGLGFPSGIIEIFGPEGSFKTGVMENIIAEAQHLDYYAGLFPTEYSANYKRMKKVGIDVKRLLIFDECETIEDIYDYIRETVKTLREKDKTTPIVFGWDSVASTPTRSEIEEKASLDKSDMGRSALQISRFFRRMVKFLRTNGVCLICVNQTRTNIGVTWGSKETTYGGKALKFYSWVRCRTAKIKSLKNGDGDRIGALIELQVVKNKVGLNETRCQFPILWGKGIDKVQAVWEYAVDRGVFTRNKSTYRFGKDVVTRSSLAKYYSRHQEEIDSALRKASCLEGE
jgi:recombination protein RecA